MKLRNMTCIYIHHVNKILMLYKTSSKVFAVPQWSGIGGHFEEYELNDPDSCILRELYEETGITKDKLRGMSLRYITIRLAKGTEADEIRQQYIYFAELTEDTPLTQCHEGLPEWVECSKVLSLPMSFTNQRVLEHYYKVGKNTSDIYVLTADAKGSELCESVNIIRGY